MFPEKSDGDSECKALAIYSEQIFFAEKRSLDILGREGNHARFLKPRDLAWRVVG